MPSLTLTSLQQFRRPVQIVLQFPYSSLDPRQTLKTIVERPLVLNTDLTMYLHSVPEHITIPRLQMKSILRLKL